MQAWTAGLICADTQPVDEPREYILQGSIWDWVGVIGDEEGVAESIAPFIHYRIVLRLRIMDSSYSAFGITKLVSGGEQCGP